MGKNYIKLFNFLYYFNKKGFYIKFIYLKKINIIKFKYFLNIMY